MAATEGTRASSEAAGTDNPLHEVAHAAVRGAIGAMAMTGVRVFTVHIGLVGQTPPEAITRQRAKGVMRRIPRKRRPAAVELMHWIYGAVGGAFFGALPDGLRRRPWAGPVYGFVTWLGFEAGVAPVLGLKQATTKQRPVERIALVVDHLLYGFVLSEMRRRPQD